MILLDQVRHGFFTAVLTSPPAATWSRLRNLQVPGQVPLRSRQCPLGLMSLSPESQSKVRASNFSLEVSSWFAEQILTSPHFLLVFPEDFGGESCTGPASPWSAREFTDLSDAVEAQRGAVYLCRFASEYRRSVGLLTNVQALSADMYLGWPAFNTHDSTLQYCGPLPSTCACSTKHPSLRGLATQGGFRSFLAQSLGPKLWARILSRMQESQLHCSLRDGVQSGTAGIISLMVVSLVTASLWLIHRTRWQHCTRNGMQTHLQGRYSVISQHPDSTLSSSQGVWLVMLCYYSRCSRGLANFWVSRRPAHAGSGFPVVSSCASPAHPSVRSPGLRGDVLVPAPISVTLRIMVVLRVSQGFSQCCLAVQPSTGRRVLSTPRRLEMGRYGSILLSLTSPSDFRTRLICRRFHEVQHLWTLSTLRHLVFRARRRRGTFHGSLMSKLGGGARSWTLLAIWLRYVVLGSRVPPHRHVRVCNHLRRPGGSDGNGRPSLPAACPVTSCTGCVLTF